MGVKFTFSRYDFSNNINVPEDQFQERRLEEMDNGGWAIVATDLSDVYLSILWRQDGSEKPASEQPSTDQGQEQLPENFLAELSEANQRREQAEQDAEGLRAALGRAGDQLNEAQAERDQLKELVRQLQARESDAPASVESGSAEQPAEVAFE